MNNKQLQAGGTLGFDKYYVKRQADDLLLDALKQNQFCYVLAARQMGKSSLMIRMEKALKEGNFVVTTVDISAIGTKQVNVKQFYNSLFKEIANGLDIPFPIEIFDFDNFSLQYNFQNFIKFILEKEKRQICVLFDEVDKILDLNFDEYSSDDFFSFIRYIKNLAASKPQFTRINFAVLGVATPSDLIRSKERTPFNIGTKIDLNNFTEKEASLFLNSLQNKFDDPPKALKKILEWTGGQPYLTQAFCEKIELLNNTVYDLKIIDEIARETFISKANEERNLSNITNRILLNKEHNVEMLLLLSKIRKGARIKPNAKDKIQEYLKLTGAVVEKEGVLIYANKMYEEVYSLEWINDQISKFKIPFLEELAIWNEGGQKTKDLLNGMALKRAFEWKGKFEELPEDQQNLIDEKQKKAIEEFLEESVKEEEVQIKLANERNLFRKRLAGTFVTLLIIAFGISTYFLNEARKENLFKAEMGIPSLDISRLEVGNIFVDNENKEAFEKYLKTNAFSKYLPNLQQLDLWDLTSLSSLEGIEKLQNLQQLSLYYLSSLTSLEGIEKLQNLQQLSIRSSSLTSLEGIEKLQNLQQLSIRSSSLTSLEGIEKLQNLQQLSLYYLSSLTSLEGIEKLQNLQQLSLYELTSLTSLEGTEQLDSLKKITIHYPLLDKLKLEKSLDTLFVFYSVFDDFRPSNDYLKQNYGHLYSKHKYVEVVEWD